MKDTFFSGGARESCIVQGVTVQLYNLGTEGKQTYIQVPTLALSSHMHLDKCLLFSKPQCFQLLDRNGNSYLAYCKD